MRSAYYSDLCSKFMIENTILKMEYAEVRVFSISDKVGSEFKKINNIFFIVILFHIGKLWSLMCMFS